MRVGVEIGNSLTMMISANSVRWGGDREFDDEDISEQCELGWI